MRFSFLKSVATPDKQIIMWMGFFGGDNESFEVDSTKSKPSDVLNH